MRGADEPQRARRCSVLLRSALNALTRVVAGSDTSVALWALRAVRVPRRLGLCCVWVHNLIRPIYGGPMLLGTS
jgi:hypothetical protein